MALAHKNQARHSRQEEVAMNGFSPQRAAERDSVVDKGWRGGGKDKYEMKMNEMSDECEVTSVKIL